jgi:hypothetical protein
MVVARGKVEQISVQAGIVDQEFGRAGDPRVDPSRPRRNFRKKKGVSARAKARSTAILRSYTSSDVLAKNPHIPHHVVDLRQIRATATTVMFVIATTSSGQGAPRQSALTEETTESIDFFASPKSIAVRGSS